MRRRCACDPRADSDRAQIARGAGSAEAIRRAEPRGRVPARACAVPRRRSRQSDRDAVPDRLAARAGTLERREAEQVLGLALYAGGRFAEALPYLEATRAWARDNIELNYFLGLAYLQTGKIDAARGALAVTFGVRARGRRRASDRRADADSPEPRRACGCRAQAGAREEPAPCRMPASCLARWRSFAAASTRAPNGRAGARRQSGNAMAWYQLGDVYVREGEVGPGDRDAAAVAVDQPVLQRPLHPARPRLHEDRADARRRKACCAAPSNTTRTTAPPHYLLAQLLQQIGRHAEAKAEFAIAEKLQGQPGR